MTKSNQNEWTYDAAGMLVMADDGQMMVAEVRGYGTLTSRGNSEEESVAKMDANGRLMADSPKMLKLIRAFYETEDTDGDEWTRAINEASEILERHGG